MDEGKSFGVFMLAEEKDWGECACNHAHLSLLCDGFAELDVGVNDLLVVFGKGVDWQRRGRHLETNLFLVDINVHLVLDHLEHKLLLFKVKFVFKHTLDYPLNLVDVRHLDSGLQLPWRRHQYWSFFNSDFGFFILFYFALLFSFFFVIFWWLLIWLF